MSNNDNEQPMSKDEIVKEIISMQKTNPRIHINGYCVYCNKEIVRGICTIGCEGAQKRFDERNKTLYDCVLCDEFNDNEDKSLLRKHMITQHYYGDLVDWVIASIIENEDYPE